MPSTRHPVQTRLRAYFHHGRQRRRWRESVRTTVGADIGLRVAVFAGGLVLVAAGVAMWLFSTVLTAPLLLAGLWVWSWEFAWARRWQHRLQVRLRVTWRRARRRPVRWVVSSMAGIAAGLAGYWALMAFGPL